MQTMFDNFVHYLEKAPPIFLLKSILALLSRHNSRLVFELPPKIDSCLQRTFSFRDYCLQRSFSFRDFCWLNSPAAKVMQTNEHQTSCIKLSQHCQTSVACLPRTNSSLASCDPWRTQQFLEEVSTIDQSAQCGHCLPDCDSVKYSVALSSSKFRCRLVICNISKMPIKNLQTL